MQKILYIMLAIQLSFMIGAAQENEAFSSTRSILESAFGEVSLDLIPNQDATDDEEEHVVHEITVSPPVESMPPSSVDQASHAIIEGNDVSFYTYFTQSGIFNAETILDMQMMDQMEINIKGLQESGESKKTDPLSEEIQRKLSMILNETRRSIDDVMKTKRSIRLSSQEDDILKLLETGS